MARDTQTIYNQIDESIKADINLYDPANPDPTKRGLVSTSKVAIWRLWAWIVASAINLFEQFADEFQRNVEASVALASPGTPSWYRQKVFEFQYSTTDPQIVQFNTTTFSPYYATVNEALRIVTACAVTTTGNKTAVVKVAKGGTSPTALDTAEKDALTSYLNKICFAGTQIQLISTASDKIMLGYDLYYDGQYSASIEADTFNAVNDFLASASANNFDGAITLSKIEDVLQSVPGMIDVVARQVEVRPDAIPSPNAYKMVDNYTVNLRNNQPYSGYFEVDSDSGRTLADTLTFTVQ